MDTNSLMVLHRMVRDLADDMTNDMACASRDLDSYLLAMMILVLDEKLPCALPTLRTLRTLAASEGFV